MNPLYLQALAGTLASPTATQPFIPQIYNNISVPVSLLYVGTDASQNPLGITISPGYYVEGTPYYPGYFIFKVAATGAFAAVLDISPGEENGDGYFTITPDLLSAPNDIGPYPTPNSTVVIPPNGARVLVACGTIPANANLPNGGGVTRDQAWMRMGDSYVVGAGTERSVSTTVTSGTQTTNSEQSTLAGALGFSASAGWLGISASISGSLSYESTSFQEVSVAHQVVQYESMVLKNAGTSDQMFLRWQMTDTVTLFDTNGTPVGSFASGQAPVLIDGPYDPDNLPAATAVSTAMLGQKRRRWQNRRPWTSGTKSTPIGGQR